MFFYEYLTLPTVLFDKNEESFPEKHPDKKRRKFSPIWDYFIKKDNEDVVICEKCSQSLPFSGPTSNLYYHLDVDHGLQIKDKKIIEKEPQNNANINTFFKLIVTENKSQNLDQKLVEMILHNYLSLNLVEEEHFIALEPSYTLPSRK